MDIKKRNSMSKDLINSNVFACERTPFKECIDFRKICDRIESGLLWSLSCVNPIKINSLVKPNRHKDKKVTVLQ